MEIIDLLVKLGITFGGLTVLILGILSYNKDKFKIRIDNETIKRGEVSQILQKLYDDLKLEMVNQKKSSEIEIARVKLEHKTEMLDLRKQHTKEIKKRDMVIREIIRLLPPDQRREIDNKIYEMNQEFDLLE
jgi:ribonuclease BN (tRNA processing enzyme)